jgi:hypothetical protein
MEHTKCTGNRHLDSAQETFSGCDGCTFVDPIGCQISGTNLVVQNAWWCTIAGRGNMAVGGEGNLIFGIAHFSKNAGAGTVVIELDMKQKRPALDAEYEAAIFPVKRRLSENQIDKPRTPSRDDVEK